MSEQIRGAVPRRYRGRSVQELLPKIQAELGPNAVVVGRRSGLEGGIAGFFARPFVELEAKAGGDSIDLTDGTEALPTPQATKEGETAAPGEPLLAAQNEGPVNFKEALAAFEAAAEPNGHGSKPAPQDREEGVLRRLPPRKAVKQLRAELLCHGFSERFVDSLLERAEGNLVALAPRLSLREALRRALARELPALALPPTSHVAVVVGPGGAGKSTLVAKVAALKRAAGISQLRTAKLAVESGKALLALEHGPTLPLEEGGRPDLEQAKQGLLLVDTPPLSSATKGCVRALAPVLALLGPARVTVALPATYGPQPARALLQALTPLKPNSVAITHGGEGPLGVALEAACAFDLAPEFLLPSTENVVPLDSKVVVERLLP